MASLFVGLDGDSIGRKIESYLISGEEENVVNFSNAISTALEKIRLKAVEKNGRILFCSGDSILFHGDFNEFFCENLLNDFKQETHCTASIGMGLTLPEVYLGLKLAKSKGGDQLIRYATKV